MPVNHKTIAMPPPLRPGDAIGVFSPSSPATAFAPKRYARAKAFLESKGFRIIEGSLTGRRDFYRSGTIRERADELNALIRNPDVRCIMSSIGGMNSNSLLPYIDYAALKSDPKIVIGYSDVTALLLGIYAQAGLVTFYGPAAVASFGEFPPLVEETFRSFWDVTGGMTLPHSLPTPQYWTDEYIPWELQDRAKTTRPNRWTTVNPGKVRGRLIGGNLNTMLGIWGTPFMPEIQKGDILFIEDSLLDAADQERSFAHLKLAGIFDRVGGLILGKHEQFDDQGTGRRPCDILMEVMGKVSFPVMADFDCCHTHPMLTLPIGCEVDLDADRQILTLTSEVAP